MRVLHIDIDTLRPDHLGCYGYHRNTSPNIDRLAEQGVRFDNCYVSDAPCLPARRFILGQVRHPQRRHQPRRRGGRPLPQPGQAPVHDARRQLRVQLRAAGLCPVSVSPFAERHSAFWFYNGFHQMHNTGKSGGERADEIEPVAMDWMERRGREENWFLHVNVWDPHTPYRAPASFGNPFASDPRELDDLASSMPELVGAGLARLDRWAADEMARSKRSVDPVWIVMREGGPYHARYTSPAFSQYLERLRATGRAEFAAELERRRAAHTSWPR